MWQAEGEGRGNCISGTTQQRPKRSENTALGRTESPAGAKAELLWVVQAAVWVKEVIEFYLGPSLSGHMEFLHTSS